MRILNWPTDDDLVDVEKSSTIDLLADGEVSLEWVKDYSGTKVVLIDSARPLNLAPIAHLTQIQFLSLTIHKQQSLHCLHDLTPVALEFFGGSEAAFDCMNLSKVNHITLGALNWDRIDLSRLPNEIDDLIVGPLRRNVEMIFSRDGLGPRFIRVDSFSKDWDLRWIEHMVRTEVLMVQRSRQFIFDPSLLTHLASLKVLILMDIDIPSLNGLRVLKELRCLGLWPIRSNVAGLDQLDMLPKLKRIAFPQRLRKQLSTSVCALPSFQYSVEPPLDGVNTYAAQYLQQTD